MKKTIITIAAAILVFSLASCSEPTVIHVNVESGSQESLSDTVIGTTALTKIGNGLYYDRSTRIVYWWNGHLNTVDHSSTPTPYYAPNGLPYKYNPDTNTFEEIESEVKSK